jgi:hypothetical protein
MPLSGFVHFVVYSPPGTAVFFMLNEGWTPDTHRLTDILDVTALSLWLSTADAHEKNPKHRPERSPRPGSQSELPTPEPAMTVEQYMALNGM